MSTTTAGILFLASLIVALAAVHVPLGDYMYRVYTVRQALARSSACIYRLIGVDPKREQTWGVYARSVLAFSAVSVLFLYVLPAAAGPPAAVSLGFAGDDAGAGVEHRASLRHQHQLAVLLRRVHAWATWCRWPAWRCRTSSPPRSAWPSRSRWSAASPARSTDQLGNFWVDLVRGTHPHPAADRGRRRDRPDRRRRDPELLRRHTTSPPWPAARRRITGGPVACQEAIKELGTNGGGFYNANSAHPFENPNALDQLARDLPAAGDPVLRCPAPSAGWSATSGRATRSLAVDGVIWPSSASR